MLMQFEAHVVRPKTSVKFLIGQCTLIVSKSRTLTTVQYHKRLQLLQINTNHTNIKLVKTKSFHSFQERFCAKIN